MLKNKEKIKIIENRETIRVLEKTGYMYLVSVKVESNCKCNNRRFIFKDENIIYEKNLKSLIGKKVICNRCKKELATIIENPKNRYIEIENEMRIVGDIEKCSCENENYIVDNEKNIICSKCRRIVARTEEIPLSIIGRTRTKNNLELKERQND